MEKFADKPRISDLFVSKAAKKVYDLLGITKADDSNVRAFDQLSLASSSEIGELVLYSHLVPTSTTYHVKGIIVKHTAHKDPVIVCQSFPHTVEFSTSEAAKLDTLITDDTEITNAEEGTILRVFCIGEGGWHISTHKKIDGTSSKWSGPTFGELFYDIWGKDSLREHLITGYCYVFLLRHPRNKVVCTAAKELLLVATYEPDYNGKLRKMNRREMLFTIPSSTFTPHPYTVQPLIKVSSFEELLEVANRADAKATTGTLVYNSVTKSLVKIVAPDYDRLRLIRGNETRVGVSYLSARCENCTEGSKTLRSLFPEEKETFDKIDEAYYTLENTLQDMYTARYTDLKRVQMSGPAKFVVCRANELVIVEGIPPSAAIKRVLSTSTPAQLYTLLNLG